MIVPAFMPAVEDLRSDLAETIEKIKRLEDDLEIDSPNIEMLYEEQRKARSRAEDSRGRLAVIRVWVNRENQKEQ